MLATLTPPSARQRLETYQHRLARSGESPIEHGWRVQAGMRYLRELNARPSPLRQPKPARLPLPPRET